MGIHTRSQPLSPSARALLAALGGIYVGLLVLTGVFGWMNFAAPSWIKFLGRFHTLLLHLPVGLLLWLAAIELISLASEKARARAEGSVTMLLGGFVLSGVGAFTLGLMLAKNGGYPKDLIASHRTFTLLGLVAGAIALSARLFEEAGRKRAGLAYRSALGVTVLLMTWGAHQGGSLTRGESYLLEYAPSWISPERPSLDPEAPREPSVEPKVLADVVMPIFRAKCLACHGEAEAKGRLRLDARDAMLRGGKEGPAVVPGDPEKSLVIVKMMLPSSHDEVMPPEGEIDVTDAEIAAIRFWIERGATEEQSVRDGLVPESARELFLNAARTGPAPEPRAPRETQPPSAAPSASSPASPSDSPTAADEPIAQTSSSNVSSSNRAGAEPPGELVYRDHIAPILAGRCDRCHGEAKHKGKLRTDSVSALLTGGRSGPAILPRASQSSELVRVMRLPLSHDEHMPPPREAQPTEVEIALVAAWIDGGASETMNVQELPKGLAASAPSPSSWPASSSPTAPSLSPSSSSAPSSSPVASSQPIASSPSPSAAPSSPAPIGQAPSDVPVDVAKLAVMPIFEDRCQSCHEGAHGSGGFAVESHEALLRGGDSGPGIVPFNQAQSLALARMDLALTHADHMPPEELNPPAEIALIAAWIGAGAPKVWSVAPRSLPSTTWSLFPALPKAPSLSPPPTSSSPPSPGPSPSASAPAVASADAPPALRPRAVSPEAEPPPAQRGSGCASCTIGGEPTSLAIAPLAWSLAFAAALLRRRMS